MGEIPLLPYNVDKKSVNDLGPTLGSQQMPYENVDILVQDYFGIP